MALLYPSVTGDDVCDLALDPDNENQYIVWGIGGLGETAFRHFTRAQSKANTDICTAMTLYCIPLICVYVYTDGDPPLHLGRAGSSDCMSLQCSTCEPYQNERLTAPSGTTFTARIGPSGDVRGYIGITGEENPLIS